MSTRGIKGRLHPQLGVMISIPDPIMNTARGIAMHNRISRQAATKVLQHHHIRRMPGHFRQTNRGKYDHRERTKAWKRQKRKRFNSITDLVASGRSRDYMMATYPRVRFSGNPAKVLEAYLRYRWPFPVSRDVKDPRRVTIDQMSKEIASWTTSEMQDAINLYRDTWVKLWEKELAKRPKWKKQLGPKLAGI